MTTKLIFSIAIIAIAFALLIHNSSAIGYGYRRQQYSRPSHRLQSSGYRRPSYGHQQSYGNSQSTYGHQQSSGYGQQSKGYQASCFGLHDGTLIGDVTTNCKRFFTCLNGSPVALYCTHGKSFDSYIGACASSYRSHCSYKPIKPIVVIPTAIPTLSTIQTIIPSSSTTTTTTEFIPLIEGK